jgi:hypothetical protein
MNCSECDHLNRVFESRLAGDVKARADPFFQVSSALAARKQVDMERAKSDVEEHQLGCHSALGKELEGRSTAVFIQKMRHVQYPALALSACKKSFPEEFSTSRTPPYSQHTASS